MNGMIDKLLIDSNVIIDAISQRSGENIEAKELYLKIVSGELQGYLVSKQITDIYYSLRKYVDEPLRKKFLSHTLKSFTILPLGLKELEEALSYPGNDYEDNVLMAVSKANSITTIITNNKKDFDSKRFSLYTPGEYLSR